MDVIKYLESFLKDISNYELPCYDKLPDMDLYMEQVNTYIDRVTNIFSKNSFEKIITPAMINNYVKAEVIPKPSNKKYNKEHIGYIIALASLKHVMPINDIKKLFDISLKQNKPDKSFNIFKDLYNKSLKEISTLTIKNLKSINKNNHIDLVVYALKLAIEAFTKIIISERIIYLLKLEDFNKKQVKKRSTTKPKVKA